MKGQSTFATPYDWWTIEENDQYQLTLFDLDQEKS